MRIGRERISNLSKPDTLLYERIIAPWKIVADVSSAVLYSYMV